MLREPGDCGRLPRMVGDVVNLNRFRKKKQREDKAKQAEINRVRHGRTKADRERELLKREVAARVLEGKRLDGDSSAAEVANDTDEGDAGGSPKD